MPLCIIITHRISKCYKKIEKTHGAFSVKQDVIYCTILIRPLKQGQLRGRGSTLGYIIQRERGSTLGARRGGQHWVRGEGVNIGLHYMIQVKIKVILDQN